MQTHGNWLQLRFWALLSVLRVVAGGQQERSDGGAGGDVRERRQIRKGERDAVL